MADLEKSARKRPQRRSSRQAAARFIEELSWLLSAYSDLDFKTLQQFNAEGDGEQAPRLFERFAPKNPNVVYLVGTLPGLFMDETLFPSNEDIAEFSATALNIRIPRWQKKAKFELVGHIVCHAVNLDNSQVEDLVRALTHVVNGESAAHQLLKSRRERGMGWNEVIQSLLARET
ncbi:MAG: hypothetical protein F9K19_26125 [Rhizobiaceae bacterium]|nr:MAG: hypothetical protein F9K19_26125 [Rhizobiaceae bacterium]